MIAFVGDSITEHLVAVSDAMENQIDDLPPVASTVRVDRHEKRGWVALLISRITIEYPDREVRFLNAGHGGQTSRLLLQRFQDEVVAHTPNWCLVSAGVVDVRRSFQPERAEEAVPLEEYRSNLRTVTRNLVDAGARVILLEPTPHSRPPTGATRDLEVGKVNETTLSYAAAMAEIAADCGAGFVPLYRPVFELERRLNARSSPATLYADEVHFNAMGDLFYSEAVFSFLKSAWHPISQQALPAIYPS